MNAYTVMLRVPEDYEHSNQRDLTWLGPVKALSPTHAAHRARVLVAGENENSPDDYEILAVFEGCIKDHYEPTGDQPHLQSAMDAEMAEVEG